MIICFVRTWCLVTIFLVSDLHWVLALYLLKVAFGHFFLISLWIWPCVLVGAYDLGFWVELYDPVCKSFYRAFALYLGPSLIFVGYLICTGALHCLC